MLALGIALIVIGASLRIGIRTPYYKNSLKARDAMLFRARTSEDQEALTRLEREQKSLTVLLPFFAMACLVIGALVTLISFVI